MSSKEYYQEELKKIEKWEKEQLKEWLWEKIGRFPFLLLDKITPQFIHDKVGKMIDELSSYVETGGRYLISEKQLLKSCCKYIDNPFLKKEDIKNLSLDEMDLIVKQLSDKQKNYATLQGATTGFGGIYTLLADIPLVLGMSLKVLQEISIAYGFDPKNKEERIFIVKCLQFANSDAGTKKSLLEEFEMFQDEEEYKKMVSRLKGWRNVIMSYRDTYGLKKLLQTVPVVGLLFGAYFNRKLLEDVSMVGKMMYRKRRIIEKMKLEKPSYE